MNIGGTEPNEPATPTAMGRFGNVMLTIGEADFSLEDVQPPGRRVVAAVVQPCDASDNGLDRGSYE